MLLLQVRFLCVRPLTEKTHKPFLYTALLLYEYAITLGEESRFIWRDVRAGHATLFMINRLNMVCMFVVMVGGTISLNGIVVSHHAAHHLAAHIRHSNDVLGVLLHSRCAR